MLPVMSDEMIFHRAGRVLVLPGPWLTRCFEVELSDGSHRSTYAISQAEAEVRIARMLGRHGDARRVVPADPGQASPAA